MNILYNWKYSVPATDSLWKLNPSQHFFGTRIQIFVNFSTENMLRETFLKIVPISNTTTYRKRKKRKKKKTI